LQKQNAAPAPTLLNQILSNIPADAELTRVEYEGPRIALYTRKPQFLLQNNYIISDIVNTLKKRVVVRTEKAIRKPEEEAKAIIDRSVPKEAGVSNVFFDEALGEVILEARKPLLLTLQGGFDTIALTGETGWRVRVRKAPHINSASLQTIYYALKSGADERERLYRDMGENIFRPRLMEGAEVTLLTLGGFKQVGRSCLLLMTKESKIMLDCGVHPGARHAWDAYPRLDWANVDPEELDAVIISHAHIDHQGFLPALFKYGYEGPVYCSEPTLPLMTLLQIDMVMIA
jgi:hypothetical protein